MGLPVLILMTAKPPNGYSKLLSLCLKKVKRHFCFQQMNEMEMFSMSKKIVSLVATTALTLSLLLLNSPAPALADGETVTCIADLQKYIAADMTDRDDSFSLHYTGDTTPVLADLKNIFLQSAGSDDYLSLSWKEMGYTYSYHSGQLDINFTLNYHTTKEEEEYVDSTVKKLVAKLITPKMNDLSKETAIHQWIVQNVKYDYSLKQITAYTALTDHRTTCMGYAMLMKKMLQQAGLESKIITGYYPEGYHAWNMIKIDAKWYYLDVTSDWAIGETSPQNRTEAQMTAANYTWDRAQSAK